ncbi:MAG TPA: metallophosphoesterase [Gemmataceae bacterium]|nr:metallophosphoesterase [Gemmataceae bacterium]
MARRPRAKFMFANTRPRPGHERGSRNKAAQIPFPPPTPDPTSLVLDFNDIVEDPSVLTAIKSAKKIVFHTVGDTGGVRDGAAQQTLIAEAMEADFSGDRSDHPAFLYHLGDVVYYNSEPDHYVQQYFKPYQYYPAPIVAIAGNHDSSPSTTDTPGDLGQFMKVFCDNTPRPLVPDYDRTSMTQPYLYFTLEAPFVKIIGLYSNNGEGPGVLDPNGDTAQLEFLEAEFRRAAKARPADSRAVLVAVHHPLFSIGKDHGASPTMLDKVDKLMDKTRFIPDAFLSGHVHGFELFYRDYNGHEIPYVICGTGGYNDDAHVKDSPRLPAQFEKGFSLAQFFDFQYGYMRMTVDKDWLTCEYVGVAKRTTHALPQPAVLESFNVDLKKHVVSSY